MALRVCTTHGCPNLYPDTQGTRCKTHRREADKTRGDRGYATKGHRAFRAAVLDRDPICIQCRAAESTIADHHPHSRRELIDAGLNPNDPHYGRGLCKTCHDQATARHQPGGWHDRP